MGKKVILATCALNQWALDFEGNYHRILQSKLLNLKILICINLHFEIKVLRKLKKATPNIV